MSTGHNRITIPSTPNPKVGEPYTYNPKRGNPFLFLVRDPNGQPAFEYMLALHTNPESLSERMTKNKNVVMTYGGFVEFIWPDELDAISGSHSTGAFLGPNGLVSGFDTLQPINGTAPDRKNTIAWERMEDLLELFRQNGIIYDGNGKPIFRGTVEMIYDRGIFRGFFRSFTITEEQTKQFSFQLDWEFKVEQTVYKFPSLDFNKLETGTFRGAGNTNPQTIESPTKSNPIEQNDQFNGQLLVRRLEPFEGPVE